MVNRITQAISERDAFKGLTQSQMILTLEEWLLNKVADQTLVLIHTPTNVCCRSVNAKDTPPCAKVVDDVAPLHADPERCAGAKCGWSLFTSDQSDDLNKELVFYKHLLNALDPNNLSNQYLLAHAHDFVETYDPINDMIKSIPIESATEIARYSTNVC